MRPVALAGFSGGLAGTLLQLLRDAAVPNPPGDFLGSTFNEVCTCSEPLWRWFGFEFDPKSLAVGICLGLALGPILECICLLRQLWSVYLRAQVAAWRPVRSSYRVLG